jgi:hypothetical protein
MPKLSRRRRICVNLDAEGSKGSERSQRRISPRGHRPESETTRPLKTDEQASGSVGRITPGMAVQELPKESLQPFPQHRELPHYRQYFDGFFNGIRGVETSLKRLKCAKSRRSLAVRVLTLLEPASLSFSFFSHRGFRLRQVRVCGLVIALSDKNKNRIQDRQLCNSSCSILSQEG